MLLQLPALNYYRTNENKWKSWVEVETALGDRYRNEFYAERLEQQIKDRKQRDNEPVFEYITDLQALYNKMPNRPAEEKQLHQTYINMRPEYLPLMRPYLATTMDIFTNKQ